MERTGNEVVTAVLVALAAGYVLWPPGHVYWTEVADAVGEPATLAAVALLAGAVGGAVAASTGAAPASLALGGGIAYVVGMALIETLVTPDSPVHFVLYAALLVCWLAGAAVATRIRRREAATP
ncbi:hypothetical protein [Halostella litorea]|uniref:hypothetical protein n=1 Tax=Halostella litorea TaxID=2528831 RepID=UPI001092145D|nr:hypothetical protein [Halostella litorea]